jgi:hypothetical protein
VAGPYLREPDKRIRRLPRIIVKGVSELFARAVRARCQAIDLQCELRRFGENNSDLLHRSNTPGYLFALGALLPWGAVLTYCAWHRPGGWLGLVVVAAAGPAAAAFVMRYAHWLVPAMARLPPKTSSWRFPPSLAARYQTALGKVSAPELKGTLRRLFERVLAISVASKGSPADVVGILDGAQMAALNLAERGFDLAEAAQAGLDRLRFANEPGLMATLEALRARQQTEPREQLSEQILVTEQALAEVAALEQAYHAAADRLLRVLAALERASVDLLLAGAPQPTAVTAQIERLSIDTAVAKEVAQEMAELEPVDPGRPPSPRE